MKKGKIAKEVSVIGGADGPTSIFLVKKTNQVTLLNRIRRNLYEKKKHKIEKRICANPHTLQEVILYIKEKYGAKEISKKSYNYQEQYNCVKENLLIQYKPELLGTFLEVKKPKAYNEESLKRFWDKMEQRRKKAESISEQEFPMDFRTYKIKISKLGELRISIETIWGAIDCSYSGDQKEMKRLGQIAKEIYYYYGVTEEDIKNNSERYTSLVAILST